MAPGLRPSGAPRPALLAGEGLFCAARVPPDAQHLVEIAPGRHIDSLQLTANHKVATPVNWKYGEDVIIAGSVSDEEAKKQYPKGWKAPKPYIRIVPQPR